MLIETLVSAISPGTEMLFYRGEIEEGTGVDAVLAWLQSFVERQRN